MSNVPAAIADRRRRARLAFVAVLAAAAWTGGLARFATLVPERIEDETGRTDAIVVLTGGSARLDAGLDLLARRQADRLFVSGVYQGIDVQKLLQIARRDSADNQRRDSAHNQGRDGAHDQGRDGSGIESRIALGTASNTRGNAAESAAWAARENIRSLRLVTGAYHMPRSLLEFRAATPAIAVVPHPVFPEHVKADWWAWPGTLLLIASEYNKTMLAWTRHRLRDAARWIGEAKNRDRKTPPEKPS